MQVRARQRTDFIHGKIKNVPHSRLSSQHRSAFLCDTATVWDKLYDTLTSTYDDPYSIERDDPRRRYRSALRAARRAKCVRLRPHPLTGARALLGTLRADRLRSGAAPLLAGACCSGSP
jgi:hypothetical protein